MQKKIVNRIIGGCFALVIGITTIIALLIGDRSEAASDDITAQTFTHNLIIKNGKLFTFSGISVSKISTETNWVGVSSGLNHSLAINSLGELYAWGTNTYGQLGDDTTANKSIPTKIGNKTNWVSIAAGDAYSLAINALGELWAWGRNAYGQLGDGTTTDRHAPVRIGNMTNWKSIAASTSFHSLAINNLGELWAWGNNSYGEVGDGTQNNKRTSPVRVGTAKNWVSISVGMQCSIALNSFGERWAWGSNSGQFGDSTYSSTTPKKIGTASNWISIASGYNHSLAINSLGELWACGSNSQGQVGDGTTTYTSSLVRIGTASNWVSVAAIAYNSAAINDLGEVWKWGNGTPQPVRVNLYRDVAAPNSGHGYTVSAPSANSVLLGDSYTFTVTRTSGIGHIGLKLSTTCGTLELTNTNGNVYTYTVSNVIDNITASNFTVTTFNVAKPSNGTGYTTTAQSESPIVVGGVYIFTITLATGYDIPRVRLNTTNGILSMTSVDQQIYTYTVSNIVGNITANNFSISVSKIQ